jgi:Ni,Fe-hydrogenase III small subunit
VFGRQASQHSVWLFSLNSGSCNGCEQEIGALHAARYALEARGIAIASSPRHADILLLTGIMTPRSRAAARRVWEQLAEPRALVAVGDCPLTGSAFRGSESFTPAAAMLPVDVELPGCPPSPALILEAIEAATRLLDGEAAGEPEAEEAEGEEAETASEREQEGEASAGDEDEQAEP